jgi:hypothetical protein
MSYFSRLYLFVFVFKTKSHYVAQAGLKFMILLCLPSAGITGVPSNLF